MKRLLLGSSWLILVSLFLTLPAQSSPFLKVSISEPTALIKSYMLVDTFSETHRVIEVDAASGDVIWQWKIPEKMVSKRSICQGSTATLMRDGSINVLVAKYGLLKIRRDGSYKELVRDDEMDHNAHQYESDKVIYTRGFVDKSEPSIVVTKTIDNGGERILEWVPNDIFSSKEEFNHTDQNCRSARRKRKENEKDWAHANHAEVLSNGNYLISLRNLSLFLEMGKDGEIIKQSNSVFGVHQPTPYKGGYIAADRACRRQSIHHINASGDNKKLFTGKFAVIRGIHHLKGDNFLITSATTVSEISLDGKVHYQAHILGVSSDIEENATRKSDLENDGFCSPKTLYNAFPTSQNQ
tara:strand:+ start:1073 stop:2134 length:1062 start_codon:yes stop_codon:yes gene_type:complete